MRALSLFRLQFLSRCVRFRLLRFSRPCFPIALGLIAGIETLTVGACARSESPSLRSPVRSGSCCFQNGWRLWSRLRIAQLSFPVPLPALWFRSALFVLRLFTVSFPNTCHHGIALSCYLCVDCACSSGPDLPGAYGLVDHADVDARVVDHTL